MHVPLDHLYWLMKSQTYVSHDLSASNQFTGIPINLAGPALPAPRKFDKRKRKELAIHLEDLKSRFLFRGAFLLHDRSH